MLILRGSRQSQNMVLAQVVSADGSAIFHELIDRQNVAKYYKMRFSKQMREMTFDFKMVVFVTNVNITKIIGSTKK
jgi:hypothetical protein